MSRSPYACPPVGCPLRELLDFYAKGETPPLEWAVRWSRDARGEAVDLMQNVWDHATDAFAMWEVLGQTGVIKLYPQPAAMFFPEDIPPAMRCRLAYVNQGPEKDDYCRVELDEYDECPECVAKTRAAVPVPPTFVTINHAFLSR